ncbi:response regulator [Verrucomicrobiota bacterium sgz303538]
MKELSTPSSKTILVVDDEMMVRNIAVRLLRQNGYKTLEAIHGREAVDTIAVHKNEIDAVLLDLKMPVMGGEEAFHEIRRLAPTVPVVLSSGFTENAVTSRFKSEAPTGFLQKPFTAKQLTEVVQMALNADGTPPRSDTVTGG